MSRHPSDRKVYVGDLGNNARKNDLEYVFGAYGSLRSVWIARNPPGFAFVEFESARDAADAVRGLDGRQLCGRRARVELSTGKYARSGGGGGGGGGGGPGGGGGGFGGGRDRGGGRSDDKCYECGMRGHFARHCRERKARQRRRTNSLSRSRSTSRRRRTRSKSGTRSRSRSPGSVGRRSGRSRENGRDENGSVSRYSDHDRNGTGGVVDSPPPVKRRYDDDDDDRDRGSRSPSPPPRRASPSLRRRGDSSVSRSMSRD